MPEKNTIEIEHSRAPGPKATHAAGTTNAAMERTEDQATAFHHANACATTFSPANTNTANAE